MDNLKNYLAPSTSKQLQKHKHYTDLTSWASDAVDAGHIVGPDMDAPVGYVARDKQGKVVGRYSYMAGETGPYETGSLPLREDAGAGGGGIGSASVSGAPVSQANFQHFDGPKTQFLKKARKMRRNKAK